MSIPGESSSSNSCSESASEKHQPIHGKKITQKVKENKLTPSPPPVQFYTFHLPHGFLLVQAGTSSVVSVYVYLESRLSSGISFSKHKRQKRVEFCCVLLCCCFHRVGGWGRGMLLCLHLPCVNGFNFPVTCCINPTSSCIKKSCNTEQETLNANISTYFWGNLSRFIISRNTAAL